METQPQSQQQYSGGQIALPNATAVLVMGIISIVGCFCYGIVGLICGIVAMVLAKKDMALYNANPSSYLPASFNNLKAGRTCAIIGLILSALYVLFYIIVIIIFGAAILSNPQEIFNQMR
jgi:hypothetical protein